MTIGAAVLAVSVTLAAQQPAQPKLASAKNPITIRFQSAMLKDALATV